MKYRLVSIASAVVMLLALVVGCTDSGAANPTGQEQATRTPQLVVAMSPILVYDDGDTIIPYNDIKNASKTDYQQATLTSLTGTTPYNWMFKGEAGWKKREAYTLDTWIGGAGARAKGLYAYAYNNEGTTSLGTYSTKQTALTAYDAEADLPQNGLLLSVTGSQEEALTYTVQKDGVLNLVGGSYVAVKSVAGAETGFLAEDGTARSASFRILVNDVQVYSGTLCNSTASPDGKAVTTLSHGQLSDISVKAGSTVLFAVKLNATANKAEDQSAPAYNDDDNWTTVNKDVLVPITDNANSGATQSNKALSIFDGFDSRFVVMRDSRMDSETLMMVSAFRGDLEFILDTEVLLRNERHDESLYEIVIGRQESRPESLKIYNELINHRVNNANDFIVRRVGTKVYIAATNTQSMQAALNHFLETFCKSADGAVPANYNYVNRPKMLAPTIGGNSIGQYVIRTEKYATTMVWKAAEELQTWVRANSGYLLPLEPMTDNGKHYSHEIQVGPLNGSVKLYRAYDTRFTSATTNTVGQFRVDDHGFMDEKPAGYYKMTMSGNHLVINGGSTYAVNAAIPVLLDHIKANKVGKGYTQEGTYQPGAYTLTDGYGMAWQEDFSYTGTDAEIDKEVREYYAISSDTTNGPTPLGTTPSGEAIWDEQRRPGIYGENWWIWHDPTGNGYLLEITKKESYGYDAGRLISGGRWAFRYGIWETRLVMGTRNGACSAVWASSGPPDRPVVRNEHDLYENFGQDIVSPCYHTWAPDNLGGHVNELPGHPGLTKPAEGEHFWDTFHSIACEWTPDYVEYYLDGKQLAKVDLTDKISGQSSTTIKFANGVGTGTYSRNYNPFDWMDAEYIAKTGKTVEDFFEVQTIDYSYIFQTSNEGKNVLQKSYIKYDSKHPSSEYYTGYLSQTQDFTSVQLPH